jgi:hypothetical protein
MISTSGDDRSIRNFIRISILRGNRGAIGNPKEWARNLEEVERETGLVGIGGVFLRDKG